jgi:hypothetical protein
MKVKSLVGGIAIGLLVLGIGLGAGIGIGYAAHKPSTSTPDSISYFTAEIEGEKSYFDTLDDDDLIKINVIEYGIDK